MLAMLVVTPAPAQELGGGAVERYVLPAATAIDLIIEEPVSSDERTNGDRFPLRVAEDVLVGGVVVIPAGSPGEGRTRLHAQSLVDSFEDRDQWLASGMETGVEEGYGKLDTLVAEL